MYSRTPLYSHTHVVVYLHNSYINLFYTNMDSFCGPKGVSIIKRALTIHTRFHNQMENNWEQFSLYSNIKFLHVQLAT